MVKSREVKSALGVKKGRVSRIRSDAENRFGARRSVTRSVGGILLFMLITCGAEAASSPFSKATVFFLGWDLETRQRLSPADVRRMAATSFTTSDPTELDELVKHLNLDSLAPADILTEDPRLVIDLIGKGGESVTYFASYFNLVAPVSRQKHPIDEAFRARFHVDKSPKW